MRSLATRPALPPGRACLPLLLALALAACGGNGDDDAGRNGDDPTGEGSTEPLPAPDGAVGSVTGMPASPGPGTTPLGGTASPAVSTDPAQYDASAGEASIGWTTPEEAALVPLPGTSIVPRDADDTRGDIPVASIQAPDRPVSGAQVMRQPVADSTPVDGTAGEGRDFIVPDAPTGEDSATSSTTFRTAPEAPPDD